jgi:hypothetical protein
MGVVDSHARRLGVAQWWLLPKRRWLRPAFADEPVAHCFIGLDEAAAFLAAQQGPCEPGSGQPRPLMLAGVRWLRGHSSWMVAAEAMRLMLVPPGWSRRAAELPLEATEGGLPTAGNLIIA